MRNIDMPHNFERDFYENRAKVTLETIFPAIYSDLIHSDKPDLVNTGLTMGIEVTRGVNSTFERDSSFFFNEVAGRKPEECSEVKYDTFCALHPVKTNNNRILPITGFCVWETDNIKALKTAILKKINRIQKGDYQCIDNLSLYVFSPFFKDYDTDSINKIVSYISEEQRRFFHHFKTLFFDDCGWFYRCDLTDGSFEYYNIENQLRVINEKAKALTINN